MYILFKHMEKSDFGLQQLFSLEITLLNILLINKLGCSVYYHTWQRKSHNSYIWEQQMFGISALKVTKMVNCLSKSI